jgi:signal transduction histidine kinase
MSDEELLRQRIQELEAELAEVRKHQADIGFQLRAGLVPIKGFVGTLLDDENEEWFAREDRREFYTIIQEKADQLSTILEQEFPDSCLEQRTGYEMNWQENVEVKAILESIIEVQQKRIDKHRVVLDVKPENITIEADPERLAFAFSTLIYQVIKCTLAGGEIRVIARLETDEFAPDGVLSVLICYPGIGIEQKLRAWVNSLRKQKGVLYIDPDPDFYIIRLEVEAHQGTIEESSEGVDQTAIILLHIPVRQTEEWKAREERKRAERRRWCAGLF